MMDRCRCCVLVAGCAIIVLVVGEPVMQNKVTFIDAACQRLARKDEGKSIDCEKVWSALEQAYVGQEPCTVLPKAYDHLLSVAPPQPMCNKMMFWSGTKEVADRVAEGCYQTMADTLLGSVLDGKVWCGEKGSKETFTSGCPGWSDCKNNPVRSFWSRASAEFAAVACGRTVVLLNGSSPTPFNPTRANCKDASLKKLKAKLNPKIRYDCTQKIE
ncbi:ADP-ribosyl cyclase/cyclic ADP-ribose hydrolase 1-like [Gadus chalcogrammus]|uniref:ADP-ribosyl cyclase/cyclic ADP-ribose hydrolase 1-like n=1 Tax=Gadus chalcogrammus TaxID=1042646 RepID=UPI0024C4D00E|nr:ADP-ribosyl cyclase/cyclic ADP-ribose hydrolase 1-like [Gadus chalcogrammus]